MKCSFSIVSHEVMRSYSMDMDVFECLRAHWDPEGLVWSEALLGFEVSAPCPFAQFMSAPSFDTRSCFGCALRGACLDILDVVAPLWRRHLNVSPLQLTAPSVYIEEARTAMQGVKSFLDNIVVPDPRYEGQVVCRRPLGSAL